MLDSRSSLINDGSNGMRVSILKVKKFDDCCVFCIETENSKCVRLMLSKMVQTVIYREGTSNNTRSKNVDGNQFQRRKLVPDHKDAK